MINIKRLSHKNIFLLIIPLLIIFTIQIKPASAGGGSWLPGAQPVIIGGGENNECGDSDLPRCPGGNCPNICTNSGEIKRGQT